MPKLIIKVGDAWLEAKRIYTPTKVYRAQDYTPGQSAGESIYCINDSINAEDIVVNWKKPINPNVGLDGTRLPWGYQPGDIVLWEGETWFCVIKNCKGKPGVFGWVTASTIVPAWELPADASSAYDRGSLVQRNGKFYMSKSNDNSADPLADDGSWKEAYLEPV